MGRPRVLAPHGTAKRYRQHRALDETPCTACKKAMSRQSSTYHARKRGHIITTNTTTLPPAPLAELVRPGTFHSDPLTGTSRGNTCMGNQETGDALCGASGGRKPTDAERAAATSVCGKCREALYKGNVGRIKSQPASLHGTY